MIDTHSHIYLSQFDTDRSDVIHKAKENGVEAILLPNIDMSTIKPLRQVVSDYQNYCFPMTGLHPTNVRDDFKKQLTFVEKQLLNNDIVGIGETGIDLYWDKSTVREQIAAFEYQLRLAKETKLPIVIHARESFETIFKVLDNFRNELPKGVFHCFSGNLEDAKRIIDYGMYIGIGGVVTFKNGKIGEILKKIALRNIILETDSPYLAPAPYRGKRNEPGYLSLILKKVAELYNDSCENVDIQTTENAQSLFPIKHYIKHKKHE